MNALKAPDVRLIPIDQIDEGERLRRLDPHVVKALATSIAESGLENEITVRPAGQRFKLVAGLHRKAAYMLLGLTEIPAVVRDLTDLQARMIEIDENLVRASLTPLERVVFIAARMEAWAESHPDQVVLDESLPKKQRGRAPKFMANLAENNAYVPTRQGFDEETAAAIGLSERSVRRIVATATGLGSDLIFQLSAVPAIASNDSMLQAVSKISDKAEQAATVKALCDGRAKTVSEARALATGQPVSKPKPAKADLKKAWKAATPGERAEFLRFLSDQKLPVGWSVEERLDGEA